MIESSVLVIVAMFIPLVAAGIINLLGSYKNLRDISGILFGLILCGCIYEIGIRIFSGEVITAKFFDLIPGIPLGFSIEPLGLIYAALASFLWVVTSIYSIGYLRHNREKNQTRFFILLSISISASIGIAFSENLLTMFVFYEMLTLFTYPLVAHKGDLKSVEAGRKYLVYLIGTSIGFFLPAIIATYHFSGTTEFIQGGVIFHNLSDSELTLLLLAFLFGIGKAAVMPFHGWLPAAMVAPTPVSALLHAVAVVKAGVFCITKIVVYIFGGENLGDDAAQYMAYIAAFTIITASVIALFQDSLKKRLAYSTISQLSYIILAVSILSSAAITATYVQMVAHAVAKITLFFAAGAIIIVMGIKNVSEMNGTGKKIPLVMACFVLASLSLIGMPYFAGGESKHLITLAANQAGMGWIIYVLYASMALNAAYFLPIAYRAFFLKSNSSTSYKVPVTISTALIITTLLTVGFSLYKHLIIQMVEKL